MTGPGCFGCGQRHSHVAYLARHRDCPVGRLVGLRVRLVTPGDGPGPAWQGPSPDPGARPGYHNATAARRSSRDSPGWRRGTQAGSGS